MDCSYNILFLPKAGKYIGSAWNLNEAVIIITESFNSYTEARNQLGKLAEAKKCKLTWFDGEVELTQEVFNRS